MDTSVWVAESVPAHRVFRDVQPPAAPGLGVWLVLRHPRRQSAARAMANHLYAMGRRQPALHAVLHAAGDTFQASAACGPTLPVVIRVGDRVYRVRQDTDITPDL